MEVLAAPQWSFGRDRALLREFAEIIDLFGLRCHSLQSEPDLNRTFTSFSGDGVAVFEAMERLCVAAFPRIDLQRHAAGFPRLGALDVCPLVLLAEDSERSAFVLNRFIDQFAWTLGDFYSLPVFYCERSERGRPESELASMRRGGFGALLERELKPDYGPSRANETLGVTFIGRRDFFLTAALNCRTEDIGVARALASRLREERAEGDERFLGVSALALRLPTKEQTQLHLTLAFPDLTPLDPIVKWARKEASRYGAVMGTTTFLGAVRPQDLEGGTLARHRPEQVLAPNERPPS